MKYFAGNQILDRSSGAVYAQVKIQNFFPHGRKKTQVPLLPCVFLGDLQLDAFIRLLQTSEKRRDRLTSLEVYGAVLDLDDHIVVKFSVERMEDVVGSPGAVIFWIAPVQMVVVDECPINRMPPCGLSAWAITFAASAGVLP